MNRRPRATPRAALSAPSPRAMTACECTGRSFDEVEFLMHRDGLSAIEAEGLTGCGSICTACIPDLRSYLGRLARPLKRVSKEQMP